MSAATRCVHARLLDGPCADCDDYLEGFAAPGSPRPTEHRFNSDMDRCVCGGQWVYFEGYLDSDRGEWGYGCEVADRPLHLCCEGRGSSNSHSEYCDNYDPPVMAQRPRRTR